MWSKIKSKVCSKLNLPATGCLNICLSSKFGGKLSIIALNLTAFVSQLAFNSAKVSVFFGFGRAEGALNLIGNLSKILNNKLLKIPDNPLFSILEAVSYTHLTLPTSDLV